MKIYQLMAFKMCIKVGEANQDRLRSMAGIPPRRVFQPF
jgi:hypothetical protein